MMTKRFFILVIGVGLAIAVAYAVDAIVDDSPVADVALSVVDDIGVAVFNADAGVYFGYFKQEDGVQIRGKTDTSGEFSASHRSNSGILMVTAEKAGHYKFREDRYIGPSRLDRSARARVAETRQWTTNSIHFAVLLKRIIQPKRLKLNSVYNEPFPADNGTFAIDLETLEWCPPFGNGKHADAILSLETHGDKFGEPWFGKLTVSMPNAADGFYLAKMDTHSAFPYPYRADTNATYRKEGYLSVNRPVGQKIETHFPADDECIIFRARTVTNAEGRVISAHYGRIGEKPQFVTGLRAAVWFNPDENDTNLEDGWH